MSIFNKARDQAMLDRLADLEGKIAAIDRSQAVIEFSLDGTIITANDNFLKTMGYSLTEIQGRRHSLFVDPAYASSPAYQEFWRRLNAGEFFADKFQRIGKGGTDIWIQATYNPVFDNNGRPIKVIKFATDITALEAERAASEKVRQAEAEQSSVVLSLAENLRRLAAGDLTANITAAFEGRFETIKKDFNVAIDSLRAAMEEIAGSTGELRSGADEISEASSDLSRRTEQQAASLEETAAALDQLTATVKRSAQGASQASTAATGARQAATRSGEIMQEAVSAMTAIEQSSGQITQIIGVIDEIAFQTNLLALNAGVEAARAGEAGRGFAVVAQEVRALAQRSAEAAKEIKGLIARSTSQVDRGAQLVTDAGAALTDIVAKVAQIDGLVLEMAQSSQEQATGLSQVNAAVNQMDQVTQQNAAMVEQAAAAAANLTGHAANLGALVSRFEIAAGPARADVRAGSERRVA